MTAKYAHLFPPIGKPSEEREDKKTRLAAEAAAKKKAVALAAALWDLNKARLSAFRAGRVVVIEEITGAHRTSLSVIPPGTEWRSMVTRLRLRTAEKINELKALLAETKGV